MMTSISSALSTGFPFPSILINNGVFTRDNIGLSILSFFYHIFQENVTSLGLIFNKLWNLSSRIARLGSSWSSVKRLGVYLPAPLVRLAAFFHNLLEIEFSNKSLYLTSQGKTALFHAMTLICFCGTSNIFSSFLFIEGGWHS